jgi:hypothetical protein
MEHRRHERPVKLIFVLPGRPGTNNPAVRWLPGALPVKSDHAHPDCGPTAMPSGRA